jgi:hypothetical protein
MKIKALMNKIYRVNPNSVECSVSEFDKLKDGQAVEMAEGSAKQLLDMGVVQLTKSKSKKKGS